MAAGLGGVERGHTHRLPAHEDGTPRDGYPESASIPLGSAHVKAGLRER